MDLIVANIVDAYRDNVALIQDPALRQSEVLDSFYLADRALLWRDGRKLVVTSLPVEPAHVRYLQQALGYRTLENLYPSQATEALIADILREDDLRARIVQRLRGEPEVALISFMASHEVLALAEVLRREGLPVTTPECPSPENMAIRDELDSKAGFRRFFSRIEGKVPGVRLPEGIVARNPAEAARAAAGFLSAGRGCVIKPNNSQSGVGFIILPAGSLDGTPAEMERTLRARLEADSQMTADVVVVEEWIDIDKSVGGGSPSVEMHIPADPQRDVEFLYLCGQILTPSGYFCGVDMYPGVAGGRLEPVIEAAGVTVAREMRRLGYVGYFDMDLVIDRQGVPYAVEVNTRRTGGTHAHEAAEAIYGPRYWERAGVISNSNQRFAGPALDYAGLQQVLGDLLFPARGRKEGILPAIVASLVENRFGYIALGESIGRAREIEQAMFRRLAESGRPVIAA